MDEPFSALDPLIRLQLQDQFKALVAHSCKKTTLFVTHDLDEAIRIGHRIAIMKDGGDRADRHARSRSLWNPARRLCARVRAGHFQTETGQGAFDHGAVGQPSQARWAGRRAPTRAPTWIS